MWWFPNNDRESTGSIGFGGNHAAHAALRSSVSYLLIITPSFVITSPRTLSDYFEEHPLAPISFHTPSSMWGYHVFYQERWFYRDGLLLLYDISRHIQMKLFNENA